MKIIFQKIQFFRRHLVLQNSGASHWRQNSVEISRGHDNFIMFSNITTSNKTKIQLDCSRKGKEFRLSLSEQLRAVNLIKNECSIQTKLSG